MENETYEVQGIWLDDDVREEIIGEVELPKVTTWQDMPKEIEINGYTYKIEL